LDDNLKEVTNICHVLGSNALSGSIPSMLGGLKQLSTMYLSKFVGGDFLFFSLAFQLLIVLLFSTDNNQLTGLVPTYVECLAS
jgi:hypothetical protein